MRVLGLISGTSHDGIDGAIVDFTLEGDMLHGTLVHSASTPYAAELRARLVAALPPALTTLAEVCELDTLIGQAFSEVAATMSDVVAVTGAVDLVVSHGQTVFHWVSDDHALGTLQIGQPAWIAERTGIPVLSDVRIRDITAGGHGAPLVSYLDALLLAGLVEGGTPAALNLGGIANMTVLRPGRGLVAFDIGPANALVDAVVSEQRLTPVGYDVDGAIAGVGTVNAALLEVLMADPYFSLPAPKSTGKEHFNGAYVANIVGKQSFSGSSADLVATLTAFTAESVARAVLAEGVDTLVVSGGGWRNRVLMDRLRGLLGGLRVLASDDVGVSTDDKEAVAFALIGWLSWRGLPGTVPAGTGARGGRVLGTLTPGARPLVLPVPLATPPAALTLHPTP